MIEEVVEGYGFQSEVFMPQKVSFKAESVESLLAKAVRWQYENTTMVPIRTGYAIHDDWHLAVLHFINPYPED